MQIAIMIEGQEGINWERWKRIGRAVEDLGFQGLFRSDHFTNSAPIDQDALELWISLAWLADNTSRIEFGPLVSPVSFRHPAQTVRQAAAVDDLSGGRLVLGLGAGWKEDEFEAYGWGFPPLRTRMEGLEDALEIATRMLGGGRATYAGPVSAVHGAINVPRGLQRPRVPILVGGNGPNRTWRLAARFADELNLDWLSPEEVAAARPVIASRCEEIGRDPATLRVSVNIGRDDSAVEGQARIDLLRRYREAGVDRVMTLIAASADDDGALARFAEDCAAAGAELDRA